MDNVLVSSFQKRLKGFIGLNVGLGISSHAGMGYFFIVHNILILSYIFLKYYFQLGFLLTHVL